MKTLSDLLAGNRAWAAGILRDDPDFFRRLAQQQGPRYLWIGCSDSRVPANQIVGLLPGEMFVHRNVANLVVHTDLNCLSALQFAVDVLQVEQIIVCGHYGCGGVQTAMEAGSRGLISNWLRPIRELADAEAAALTGLVGKLRADRLCELNVVRQVRNVANTTIVQDAWDRGQPLAVHGFVYGIADGRLHDLGVSLPEQGGVEQPAP